MILHGEPASFSSGGGGGDKDHAEEFGPKIFSQQQSQKFVMMVFGHFE